MKKSFYFSVLALTVTYFFAGCTKTDHSADALSQTLSSDATTPDLSGCKIRRIYQGDPTVSALFSYNKLGNPYSLIYSNGGTGVSDHYFIYDSNNRLKEWRLVWGSFPIEHHFYKHNASNQIVKDSILRSNPGNGEVNSIHVSTIEYDPSGRVIKETIVNTFNRFLPMDPVRRPTFTYDSRGNLAVAGWKSSMYDNKINPLRQSPVFQFVMRNYSMNNAAPQPKYNSLGLPLSMNPTNDAFFNGFETIKVVYDCQ